MIDLNGSELSVRRQCELLGVHRSSIYYQVQQVDDLTLRLMSLIDEEYTRHPFLGSRRMTVYLKSLGYEVNRKRIQSLYQKMGLETVYPKPNLSKANKKHAVFPYLLRGIQIVRSNQVWSTDITYIRMQQGFVYLMAIIDWFSRYVLDWEISTTLEADFCVETLERVLTKGTCDIFNTDQGAQFTDRRFTGLLSMNGVKISMDGKGRAIDNIFVERLWRSVKYECVYMRELTTVSEAKEQIGSYFEYYNNERPHQSLNYKTPKAIYLL